MPLNPTTPAFLSWLAGRLVGVYGEPDNVDFVQRVKHEAARAHTLRVNIASNARTYQLVKTTGPDRTDGMHGYYLQTRGGGITVPEQIANRLWLTEQQADDLARQLDAPIDYFND
jgi:hypothetical protein